MPPYIPVTPPIAVQYVAPYAEPQSSLPGAQVMSPRREPGDWESYGPDQYGSSQSGGGYAQGEAYPAQRSAQMDTYAPQQALPSSYAQPGDASATYAPWPMTQQERAAMQARAASNPNARTTSQRDANRTGSTINRKTHSSNQPGVYSNSDGAAPSPQQQRYAQPYPQSTLAQQGYPPPGYQPQQPYVQQPYPPQAYAGQPYQPQPYRQSYANGRSEPTPYIPQPPVLYPTRKQQEDSRGSSQSAQSGQLLTVEEELAQVNHEQSSTVSGGVVFRNRDGESGLSNLTDIEAPVQARIRAGDGHITVNVTPVTLDAGTATNSVNTLSRFGSGLSWLAGQNRYGSQTANGVGVGVGYEYRGWKGDIGATPFGFREQNIVGGLQYAGGISDKVSYRLTADRRAVTDSLLSYAGARDALANVEWGGVTSNRVRGDLGWDDGTSGLYVNASWEYLGGRNVASNNAVKGGSGVYTRLVKDADQTLTVGMNTTLMHYNRNLSYYTYGQGGYFSPQEYAILNLPVEWSGRNGPFTYDLKGSIGVQHYRQDASSYFPTLGAYQSLLALLFDAENLVAGRTVVDPGAVYPGQSKTGVSYSIDAVGEYQLAPQLSVGAAASFGNAFQYREFIAAVYVRYAFTRQRSISMFPPTPLQSPYLRVND